MFECVDRQMDRCMDRRTPARVTLKRIYFCCHRNVLCVSTIASSTTGHYSKHGFKVCKGANIRNRYNQVPHLTQDTNGKVTNSQLDTTNESQEVSPFPAGDHKSHINRRTQRHSKHTVRKNIKIHKRSTALERSVKYFTGELKPVYWCTNLTLSLDVEQTTYMFGLHEIPLIYQCTIS